MTSPCTSSPYPRLWGAHLLFLCIGNLQPVTRAWQTHCSEQCTIGLDLPHSVNAQLKNVGCPVQGTWALPTSYTWPHDYISRWTAWEKAYCNWHHTNYFWKPPIKKTKSSWMTAMATERVNDNDETVDAQNILASWSSVHLCLMPDSVHSYWQLHVNLMILLLTLPHYIVWQLGIKWISLKDTYESGSCSYLLTCMHSCIIWGWLCIQPLPPDLYYIESLYKGKRNCAYYKVPENQGMCSSQNVLYYIYTYSRLKCKLYYASVRSKSEHLQDILATIWCHCVVIPAGCSDGCIVCSSHITA